MAVVGPACRAGPVRPMNVPFCKAVQRLQVLPGRPSRDGRGRSCLPSRTCAPLNVPFCKTVQRLQVLPGRPSRDSRGRSCLPSRTRAANERSLLQSGSASSGPSRQEGPTEDERARMSLSVSKRRWRANVFFLKSAVWVCARYRDAAHGSRRPLNP